MNVQQTSENLDELKMLDDIYIEKNNSLQLEKQKADEFAKLSGNLKNDANTNENKSIISPTAVSVSYTASNARYYGWWFGDHYENYIFKRASLDCTNFVSQCIWSGYGGTNDYDISTIGDYSSAYDVPAAQALRKRALDNYRQTSQWYGRYYDSIYGDPISSFCGVPSLWDYATKNTGTGPKATGYSDGLYTRLSTPMKQGDILQFYDQDSHTWYHSVIVVTTTDYPVSQYTNVRVAQHSNEHYSRPLDELIQYFGGSTCIMRLLRPGSTTF